MLTAPMSVLAVLCINILVCELLVKHTFCRHLGTALLVIVVTAVTANFGIIPTSNSPVYDGVFEYVAPLAIFWLLLRVNLREVLRAGVPMLIMFLIGALGTVAGVLVGMSVIGGADALGQAYRAIGGMFVGTYIGGSVNFNAVALHHKITEQGALYAGSMAVDSIMTTVWMVATIALPRLLQRRWPRGPGQRVSRIHLEGDEALEHDTETVSPVHLSILFAAGCATLGFTDWLVPLLEQSGRKIPSILIVTTVALIMAQLPGVSALRGTRLLAMFAVYLFLAVIGAFCDLAALGSLQQLGPVLMLFVFVVVMVHGLVTFGLGAAARFDVDVVAVASQANIGGGTTALALARSLERNDLVLPAVLVGALGNALGTYLGFIAADHFL